MTRVVRTLVWLGVASTIFGFWVCNRMAFDAPEGQPFGGSVDLLVKEVDNSAAGNEVVWLDVSPTGQDLYSDEPFLQFETIVCADRALTFALVLTGAARVHPDSMSALVGGSDVAITSSDRTWVYDGQSIEAQVIEVSFPSPGRCAEMSSDARLSHEMGSPVAIAGAVSGPVIRSDGPAWFTEPRKWYALPSLGHIPGVSDLVLGRFDRPFGLDGEWSRPSTSVRVARFGALTSRAEIEVIRPAPHADDTLEWRSYDTISPLARVANADDVRQWARWGLVFAVLLGVGTSLLAALVFQWLGDRASKGQGGTTRAMRAGPIEGPGTLPTAGSDSASERSSEPPLPCGGFWWAVAVVVVIAISHFSQDGQVAKGRE